MKILNYIEQHLKTLTATLIAGSMILLTAGCGEVDGGTVVTDIPLPTDSVLNFACADEGIYLEKCVLDNPNNPYANVAINDVVGSPNNKFALSDAAALVSVKAQYYVWASALAKGAGIPGENQYYTALYLQEVFAQSGSPTTRNQAVKAYRSVLDNYFLNPTFFVETVDGVEVAYAVALKDLTGKQLYAPAGVSLYTDQLLALGDISEWGYVYEPAIGINGLMSIFR